MGYCVERSLHDMCITLENQDECLAAINKLHSPENKEKMRGGSYCSGERTGYWYSWVDYPEGGFKDLLEALEAWSFDAFVNDCGDCVIECFNGEKLGQEEEVLYTAIAPYVESGGYIESRGEDGDRWNHYFKDGEVEQRSLIYIDKEDNDKKEKELKKLRFEVEQLRLEQGKLTLEGISKLKEENEKLDNSNMILFRKVSTLRGMILATGFNEYMLDKIMMEVEGG